MAPIRVVIELDAEGRIRCNWPSEHTPFCLGMMEFAKAVMIQQANQPRQPGIVPADGSLLSRLPPPKKE